MDKYLKKPKNVRMECEKPASNLKSHVYCIDTDLLEDCKSDENLEYTDIRSFFHTKPSTTQNGSLLRQNKYDQPLTKTGGLIDSNQDFQARKISMDKTTNANIFHIFQKSAKSLDESGCITENSDIIEERINKKRHLPESSDEEEGNSSIFKVKFNWSKKLKSTEGTLSSNENSVTHKSIIPTFDRIEMQDSENLDLRQTYNVQIKKDFKSINQQLIKQGINQAKDLASLEEASKLDLQNDVQIPDCDEPVDQHNSSEDDFVKIRPSKKENSQQKTMKLGYKVDGSDSVSSDHTSVIDEMDGKNENVSLRRSSRRCSKPARFETMVMIQDELVRSAKEKKDIQLKTVRKCTRTVNSKHPIGDDNDDVVIVGMVNKDNIAMNNGKVIELAPMFRKIQKLSPEELERKKNFLMSGVPDEIKRQQAIIENQASSISLYAPFPCFKHVTQLNLEDETHQPQLPTSFLINQNKVNLFQSNSFPRSHFKNLSSNDNERPSLKNVIKISPIDDLPTEILRQLLLEIKSSNLEFPVEAIYTKLKEKQKIKSKLVPKRGPIKINVLDDESDDSDASGGGGGDDDDDQEHEEEMNMLWSEKYAPTRTNEIIGNKTSCKRTFDWLSELKAKYSNSLEDKGSNSMDDFWTPNGTADSNSVSSSSTLNALIIHGPHGVGKTSLVYAVAEELGFKVFEVNPSSARDGRQVWSQLQEATQSHQLNTATAKCLTNQEAPLEVLKSKIEVVPKSKSPKNKAMLSVFKMKALPTKTSIKSKQKIVMETIKKKKQPTKKGRFVKKRNKVNSKNSGYNTDAKKSLILFDEADVVFENDRGFWSAVQRFVKTTKRPIILTVSDEHFVQKFNMNIEVVHMRRPEKSLLSSYLQIMCLAEGIRTDRKVIESLVESFNRDLRRSIHQLQSIFSGRISSSLSTLRPICYLKSSLLEPPTKESKDVPMETSQTCNEPLKKSITKSCNGENSELKNVKLCQTALTSFLCSLKTPISDDDDDDFVSLPALKKITRRCNVVESDDDDDFITSRIKKDHINEDGDMEKVKNKNDDKIDEDFDADEKKDNKEEQMIMIEEEFVTCDCDIPVFHVPANFHRQLSGGKIVSFVNQNSSDDLRSLKQLSRSFDLMSFHDSTFSSPRLHNRSSIDPTYDLYIRKITRQLPGDLDQFGLEENCDFVNRMTEGIGNAIVESSARLCGGDFERSLKRDSKEGGVQKLNRIFEDKHSLTSDLRKFNPRMKFSSIPEVLPMLIKISKVENERKNYQSRRRFLHYLSNIYHNIHPDRFNFAM